jgi:LPXTG-site transpeptidase (sortase) family protein
VAGIIIIVFPLATEAYGYFKSLQLAQAWEQQAGDQRRIADMIRQKQDALIAAGKLPEEDAVFGTPVSNKNRGTGKLKPFPKTKIKIPKISVDQVIIEGSGPEILQFGPGHYAGMVNPGERGNCGIAGHRVTYTHPFNRLDELSKGDTIILETVDYIYEYEVESMEVTDPSDTHNLQPTPDPRITLTTCNPKYSAKTRLNVMGVLINSTARRPTIIRVVKNILQEKKQPKRFSNKPRTYAQLLKDYKKQRLQVENNPLDAYVYADFASTCIELDKYAEAYKALRRATLIEPNSVDIQKLQARFSAIKRSLETNVALSEQSMINGVRNTNPDYYFDLGNMYIATEEYDRAATVFKRGVDMMPYMSDPYVYVAGAYEKMGVDNLALNYYNQALQYDPTCPDALSGIKRIRNKKPMNAFELTKLHYRLQPQ